MCKYINLRRKAYLAYKELTLIKTLILKITVNAEHYSEE